MIRIIGTLGGILIGLCGFLIPSDAGFDPIRHDFRRPPVLPQIFLPLVGAGGGTVVIPTIMFVRQSTATAVPATTTFTVTVTAPSAGNTAIAYMAYVSTVARTIASMSMTGTGTWAAAAPSIFQTGISTHLDMWFAGVTSGGSTTLSITANLSNILNEFCVNFAEFSGIAASPLDGTGVSQAVANAGTASAPAYSTTTANDLVATSIILGNGTSVSTFPTGYTQLTSCTTPSTAKLLFPSYQIVSGSGAQTATWTFTPNSTSATNMIGFKP